MDKIVQKILVNFCLRNTSYLSTICLFPITIFSNTVSLPWIKWNWMLDSQRDLCTIGFTLYLCTGRYLLLAYCYMVLKRTFSQKILNWFGMEAGLGVYQRRQTFGNFIIKYSGGRMKFNNTFPSISQELQKVTKHVMYHCIALWNGYQELNKKLKFSIFVNFLGPFLKSGVLQL